MLQRAHAGVFRIGHPSIDSVLRISLRLIAHRYRFLLLVEVVQLAQLFPREFHHAVGELHTRALIAAAPTLVGVLLQLVVKIRLRGPQQLGELRTGKAELLLGGLLTELELCHLLQRLAHILKLEGGAALRAPSGAALHQRPRLVGHPLADQLAGGVDLAGDDAVVIGAADLQDHRPVVLVKYAEPRQTFLHDLVVGGEGAALEPAARECAPRRDLIRRPVP